MDTMHKIQKLEMERHDLFKKAGNGKANAADRDRIGEITSQLYILWDQHRRDDAVRRWGARSAVRRTPATDSNAA
jgi:hypothetical protein